MIITLSEARNEKLVIEWSDELTGKTVQDFCDVCNAVFHDHFDLDYMSRKYEPNIYGKSLIAVLYKDSIPVAAEGAWRNDIDDRPSFQIGDTATLPAMRKRGYNTAIITNIIAQLRRNEPGGQIYRFSAEGSHSISGHMGFARTYLYARFYRGVTEDFLESIPAIDDAYAERFFMHKKNVCGIRITTHGGGQYYLVKKRYFKGIIPAGIFLGQASSSYEGKFERLGRCRVMLYYSRNRGILGEKRIARIGKYDFCTSGQVMDFVPPLYKADTNSLDFNGVNA